MPPAYVKPYVKRQKNDATDAEAICEAVTRVNMRFVATKTPEQQGGFVLLVTDVLFADRSRLIEISEARTTFGKDNLRPQLDRVCAKIGVNGLAVEVAGEFYLQPGLL
jgi:transposase